MAVRPKRQAAILFVYLPAVIRSDVPYKAVVHKTKKGQNAFINIEKVDINLKKAMLYFCVKGRILPGYSEKRSRHSLNA